MQHINLTNHNDVFFQWNDEMNLSCKHLNEKFSNNQHQSYIKQDKKNSSQAKYVKTQSKQNKQYNLCLKRDVQLREDQTKLLIVQLKTKQYKD